MSKLHLPLSQGSTLDNLTVSPYCGRQLNNDRTARSQTASQVSYAANVVEYLQALSTGKPGACKHCGRVAGLLPRLTQAARDEQDSDEGEE